MDPLIAAIADLVDEAPPVFVQRVIDELADGESGPPVAASNRLRAIGHSNHSRRWVAALTDAWEASGVDPEALRLALAAAVLVRERSHVVTEPVWTGPVPSKLTMRRTDQVLLELIEGAQDELLLVSFALFPDQRWKLAIGAALDRGVKVRLVVETPSSGKVAANGVAQLPQAVLRRTDLLTWDVNRRTGGDHVGALHAKCLVADRRKAFITSANLTQLALTSNMELGVFVKSGPLPRRITELFDALRLYQVLIPY